MVSLRRIVTFLDTYLDIDEIKDDSWNGLQVEGKSEVRKAVFAVDAGIDTFKRAIQENAELVVVHHGLFWRSGNPTLVDWTKERVNLLLRNGISLYASHLPLDKHREVGNNAQLLKLLGAQIKDEFGEYHGVNIGWIGELKPLVSLTEIEQRLNTELKTQCTILRFGKEKIETIAVCSGGGGHGRFLEALQKKVDLYVTGDSTEIYHAAKDAGFNVIFAGHHATETLGVKALSEVVTQKFKVEPLFLDIPTGL